MFFTVPSLVAVLFLRTISVRGDAGDDLTQIEFVVFGPNELLIKITDAPQEYLNFITLRIGVKRANENLEDLEYGDNYFKNGNFYINDKRLQLKNGDVIHYLIAYRNSDGYQAKTGAYVFNGVYRNRRIRRRTLSNLDLPFEQLSDDESVNIRNVRHSFNAFDKWGLYRDESFDVRPVGPPFGHGPPFARFPPGLDPHHHHHHHHHKHGNGRGPPFGDRFCDSSEESDEEDDWPPASTSTTTPPPRPTTITTTTTRPTTTTEYVPNIDIRFGK